MIRAAFFIVSAIPIIVLVCSYLFDRSIIDYLENNGSYYKGAYATEGAWFLIILFSFYIFFYKIWGNLTELDDDLDFTLGIIFLRNKKYRKFRNIEKCIRSEYEKNVNQNFPTQNEIDVLNICGSYYKEVDYDILYAIVKCKLPDKKSWYSLHFLGQEKNMILSYDKKSLKEILLKK